MPRLVARLMRPALLACVLAAPAVLAGCSQEIRYAPICPQLALLADGADMVRFNGPGRDLTDRVLEAKIVGIEAKCEPGKRGQVAANIKVWMDVTRGPASRARTAQVPYFIAVMRGDEIIDRKSFVAEATFGANVDVARVGGGDLGLNFPVSSQQGAEAYKIYVSLQLTEEELAYNRRADAAPR